MVERMSVCLWYNKKCIYGNVVVCSTVVLSLFSSSQSKYVKFRCVSPIRLKKSLNKFSLNLVLVGRVSLKCCDTFKPKVKLQKNSRHCTETDLHYWCDFRAKISGVYLKGKCYELRLWRGMTYMLVSCTSW